MALFFSYRPLTPYPVAYPNLKNPGDPDPSHPDIGVRKLQDELTPSQK
jgi:hypothetical protein